MTADNAHPIGSIYMSVNSTSPASLFGGSWTQISGRFLIGTGGNGANSTTYWGSVDTNTVNCPAGETGGEARHTLTINEMPSHSHEQTVTAAVGGSMKGRTDYDTDNSNMSPFSQGSSTYSTGGNQAHNNMPPYLAVYMWKRVS